LLLNITISGDTLTPPRVRSYHGYPIYERYAAVSQGIQHVTVPSYKQIAPYGAWKSPLAADDVVRGGNRPAGVWLDGDDVYWIEGRPLEKGRNVIVRRTPDGAVADLLPPPFDARSRVHEYGGGACAVGDGRIFFSNLPDNRVYVLDTGIGPRAITPENKARYADLEIDHHHNRLLAVCEDHHDSDRLPENSIVAIATDGQAPPVTLLSGNDFYSNPRVSPDGSRFCWLSWNLPDMPWDGTELWQAPIAPDGSLGIPRLIAGGREESIFQPLWSPDNVLHFVSDRNNWWQIYRRENNTEVCLTDREAEFGLPMWVFGVSTYGFESNDSIICSFTENGRSRLARLDIISGKLTPVQAAESLTGISYLAINKHTAAFVGGASDSPETVYRLEHDSSELVPIQAMADLTLDQAFISPAQAIEFPTAHGVTAHAFYYPPANRDYQAPENERPPLLLLNHGGPTSATTDTLQLRIQYFTSRGFAVVDVNYGGSTGYGRRYRERLDGNWGIVDRQDCENAARYLVKLGKVDPDRMAIRGGSAGGYTTLCALTFGDVFAAGASHYGVSDLELLAVDTHKFEAGYLDRMVGPYPEKQAVYRERSPIRHTERLSRPAIFFQGLDDKVVPPEQTERMVQVMRDKGLPVAYLAFEGEGHGFRQGDNVRRALEAEFYFYSRMFGFTPADYLEPVPISNFE
jgi:dipeptidyl aminopeptidase/acylaminoacyl peptidase